MEKKTEEYEIVVGLEVHAQLLTKTKLFSADSTEFGKEPNTQVSPITLGHPGTLPKLNKEAVRLAVRLGIATNCDIVQRSFFARKNYFYADLPKGYQISQHTTPICRNGFLEVSTGNEKRNIRINRIHIEEDAGKSIHDEESEFSNVDFNRAGSPLVEIVSEPDIHSAEEAAEYVKNLRKLVRHLGVCDGNMEQGSLRCDVNISVRKKGDPKLGTKVELKNLNSIRFIRKAIEHESAEQIKQLEAGKRILQQTKGFNDLTGGTYVIRTKEDEDDYRYFPDPDLPPIVVSKEWIEEIKRDLPPTQQQIKQQLLDEYKLSEYDATLLSEDVELTDYYFRLVKETTNYKAAANWMIGPVRNYCVSNDLSLQEFAIEPHSIGQLIELIDKGNISYGIASQKVFDQLTKNPSTDIEEYIKQNNLLLQSADETDKLISIALNKHAEKITEYKKGKKGLISLFVGEVMKLSSGKANAKQVTEKIIEKLKDY
ncbi:MAG: Asp-tRNA(Asn)/Glu-tRNA(Gln) amidotransferase subunit GatB [Candidatus Dadabacteria bacterium]